MEGRKKLTQKLWNSGTKNTNRKTKRNYCIRKAVVGDKTDWG